MRFEKFDKGGSDGVAAGDSDAGPAALSPLLKNNA